MTIRLRIHDEVIGWIAELTARAPNLRNANACSAIRRKPPALPMLILSNAPVVSARDVLRLQRAVCWLQGPRHGRRAGRGDEAMLTIAARLAVGDLNSLLDRITVR